MRIGLLDIDGHNFPNLALMKVSTYHKNQGHSVEFADMFGEYDIIYKSKVFSWTDDPDYIYSTNEVLKGGTGFDYSIELPEGIDSLCPDYSLYNCQHAYGFLTRGCIRKCEWCIVPDKEGKIRAYNDIDDFICSYDTAILMDNNVLASEHGIEQIEKIIKKEIKIDFNQGIDCRLIDNSVAKLLSRIKWIKYIRISCDTMNNLKYVKKALKLLNNNGIKTYRIFSYVLIQDTDEALKIANYFKKIGVSPFGQPYRDFKNTPPTWKQRNIARWMNMKPAFKKMTYKEFENAGL